MALDYKEIQIEDEPEQSMLVGRKNPNHSGGIITPVASVYRLLWPKKLFHTFPVELASSECFMLLLFNHNNKNNSDDSSNKILEVLEKKKVPYPPRDSNV